MRFGYRCDLLIEAESEKEADKMLDDLQINLVTHAGNPIPLEQMELLVEENGPSYVVDEEV